MKHAFLIIAHSNFPFLSRILKTLDHEDNTIFIHIDKKSYLSEDNVNMLCSSCSLSPVHFTQRHKITWGGYSQINGELRILEAAVPMKFDYYHLISGADFLTKPMHIFHRFFEEHNGYEFVSIASDEFTAANAYRVSVYHPFRNLCGRNKRNPLYWLNSLLVKLQQNIIHVDRLKNKTDISLKSGANWFSITHNFAQYLLEHEDIIRKNFSFSLCADELFLQTILASSPYINTTHNGNMRSVEWNHPDCKNGAPHTYTIEDYDALISSENLICRKVTDQTPEGEALIKKLENYIFRN